MAKVTNAVEAICASVTAVTRDWARQRKAEERDASRRASRHMFLLHRREVSVKEAAYRVMEEAYMKASAGGTLPANARQIMYAARPLVQKLTDKRLDDQYFTQQLLPDYIAANGLSWNVVFDDRGHFAEPHTERLIGLGTLAVKDYLDNLDAPTFKHGEFAPADIETYGPDCRFGAVLFIEKEGFLPLLEHAEIAERYDVAIMSTKGLSNTAARLLVDEMCGHCGVPLLVLHDFDKAGFSIIGTLRQSNRRYRFRHKVTVIDLGLRLVDVDGLEAEQAFNRGSHRAIRANLRANGATHEEARFLLTERVELNALTSDRFIAFLERKLQGNGIKKIVPGKDKLAEAYRLFARGCAVERIIERELENINDGPLRVPRDLVRSVRHYLTQNPAARWDEAVREIATAAAEKAANGRSP